MKAERLNWLKRNRRLIARQGSIRLVLISDSLDAERHALKILLQGWVECHNEFELDLRLWRLEALENPRESDLLLIDLNQAEIIAIAGDRLDCFPNPSHRTRPENDPPA